MEQDASPTSTAFEPKDLDSSLENKNIQQLSNQLFILNESTGDKKVQDAISNVHTRDIILTDHVIGKWHISHRRLSVVAPVQNNNVTLYLKHLMKNKTVSQIHR